MLIMYRPTLTLNMNLGEVPAVVAVDVGVAVGVVDVGDVVVVVEEEVVEEVAMEEVLVEEVVMEETEDN